MSRLGSNPIALPKGIEVTVNNRQVTVKGSAGALDVLIHSDIEVVVGESEVKISRPSDSKSHKSAHGLYHITY
jgi:large subunit ribosomal protein L6